jgi:tRNA (guanosine-2'-O-)-methyltransferase
MNPLASLNQYLTQFVSVERQQTFQKVIGNRTRYIAVALEDIYQPHNASAVLRTCDCFGIQDIHVIENYNQYDVNPDVALGASKWINIIKHNQLENNTMQTIQNLRNQGYRIVATSPHANDVNLDDLDVEAGKLALFFGTELNGLSNLVLDNADTFLKIPMFGFTESFNISVSVAITLHHLTHKLHQSDLEWQLSYDEQQIVLLNWYKNNIKKADVLIENFCNQHKLDFRSINDLL